VNESAEARLAERARSPEDAAFVARFDGMMALPLVLAAVLPLMFLPGSTSGPLAGVINVVAWLVFLVDFVVHERRLRHYLGTWLGRFDLFVVVVTAPWFLIFGPGDAKFVLLIRLARIARLVMAGTGARRLFARIGRVAIVAVGVVFVGAAIAYRAEHTTNPGFATYGDSLWWAVVTITTVGYGDIVPKTTAGRVDGVMIMVTGIGVLGVLAGSLASFFRLDGSSETGAPAVAPATLTDPASPPTELVELRQEVARLADEVARLAGARGDDG
jgi:voltage-gated potassium channel